MPHGCFQNAVIPGSGRWSPASGQKVLPESLVTPVLFVSRQTLGAPVGTGSRKGLRMAQARGSSASRTSAGHILSEELAQVAHWAILPPWWAGRDLDPHGVRSSCGIFHILGSSRQRGPSPAPPPCSRMG